MLSLCHVHLLHEAESRDGTCSHAGSEQSLAVSVSRRPEYDSQQVNHRLLVIE